MPTPSTRHPDYTIADTGVLAAEANRIGRRPRCGLALSGGGIRSAAFALGVLQAFAGHHILPRFDYVSSVSGGGYIAAALTWWLKQGLPADTRWRTPAGTAPGNFPFPPSAGKRASATQRALLDYLRFHSSYLLPGNGLDFLSILAILLRNILLSLGMHISVFSTTMVIFMTPLVIACQHSLLPPLAIGSLATTLFPDSTHLFYNDAATIIDKTLSAALIHFTSAAVYIFVLSSVLFSVGTFVFQILQKLGNQKKWSSIRYRTRVGFQRWFGYLMKLLVMLGVVALPPVVNILTPNQFAYCLGMLLVAVVCMFYPFGFQIFETRTTLRRVTRTAAAIVFIYVVVVMSYGVAAALMEEIRGLPSLLEINAWSVTRSSVRLALQTHVYLVLSAGLILLNLFIGIFVNVNYVGVHRMYRDRLMELFLPDPDAVRSGNWGRATRANEALIEDMCQSPTTRPYHLINANVVLVDSPTKKFRERGGANFVISPLYCGSDATGWRRTEQYMKVHDPGITLPTAMAISGAAASPYAGAGGSGWSRDTMVSLVMSMLGLRLGYWAPHPNPKKTGWGIPNYIWPGLTSVFLVGGLNEKSKIVDLTDGGHFENLGLYELIRRRLEVIVVCDASADAGYRGDALAVATERVRVDFGATIEWPDPDHGPQHLEPVIPAGTGSVGRGKVAKRAFAVGRINYEDGSEGMLIYIKPTMIAGMGEDVVSYKMKDANFPHQTTADQFFDELQFEAYRELGVFLGENTAPMVKEACREAGNGV